VLVSNHRKAVLDKENEISSLFEKLRLREAEIQRMRVGEAQRASYTHIHYMAKSTWTFPSNPLQMSGFDYFVAGLVADRCIKSSTQSCNLHRQTLAVEWPY
jgi:hypothetical protein